jgi:hypothetical protein
MFKSTLLHNKLIFLLQEMLVINGLTHNHTVCFVSWLFDDVFLRVVLTCVVSITQKPVSVRWVHEHLLVTFYSTQFLCSDQCLVDCATVQFYRCLRSMLPLFSGLEILSFSYVPFISCCNLFCVVHHHDTKTSTLLHKSLIFVN